MRLQVKGEHQYADSVDHGQAPRGDRQPNRHRRRVEKVERKHANVSVQKKGNLSSLRENGFPREHELRA